MAAATARRPCPAFQSSGSGPPRPCLHAPPFLTRVVILHDDCLNLQPILQLNQQFCGLAVSAALGSQQAGGEHGKAGIQGCCCSLGQVGHVGPGAARMLDQVAAGAVRRGAGVGGQRRIGNSGGGGGGGMAVHVGMGACRGRGRP